MNKEDIDNLKHFKKEDLILIIDMLNKSIDYYKSRNKKAIEYITHEWFKREQIGISHLSFSYDELQHILDILRGEE